jgi:hypothetical protein
MKRLNVPLAKDTEKLVFIAPAVAEPTVPGGATIATNVDPNVSARSGDADLEQFLGPLRDDYLKAFANDLQPLRTAMQAVLTEDFVDFNSKVLWLRSQLPSLLTEINKGPKSADVLETIIRGAFERGYTQAADQRQLA